jgi:hypothetical protein
MKWLLGLLLLAGCRMPGSRTKDFADCSYAYQTENGLRKCLVLDRHWPVQDAESAITDLQARAKHIRDSLQSEADSIAGAAYLYGHPQDTAGKTGSRRKK